MTECSCVEFDCGSCDPTRVLHNKEVKGRKDHICCECRTLIPKGTSHKHVKHVWEGKIDNYRRCSDCESIFNSFFCGGCIMKHMFKDLKEHIEYMDGKIHEDCILSLTPRAKEMVCELIEKVWDKMT